MSKNRLMIIDDEKDYLSFLKANLELAGGYDVRTLSCARDVVSQAVAFKPDIIITDINMPVTGGIEACRMLKSDPRTRNTPILIVSASTTEDDINNARKAGAHDCLSKPVKIDILIAKIESILSKKQDTPGQANRQTTI